MVSVNLPYKHNHASRRRERGLTLIELLVSLVIGLVLILGVWLLLSNSRASFHTSQTQAHILDNGRYALHVLGRDLKHAGSFGQISKPDLIEGGAVMPAASGDCANLFYVNLAQRVYGVDLSNAAVANPFNGTCLPNSALQADSDVLVVRYAEPIAVLDTDIGVNAGEAFIQANVSRGQLFVAAANGSTTPTFAPDQNFKLIAHVYYVHKHTQGTDGIPSLRRIELGAGSGGLEMTSSVVLSGVENMQIQFGINACTTQNCPDVINSYVDASNAMFDNTLWSTPAAQTAANQIEAIKMWLLIRGEGIEPAESFPTSYTLGNFNVTGLDANVRREVFSGVFNVRNR